MTLYRGFADTPRCRLSLCFYSCLGQFLEYFKLPPSDLIHHSFRQTLRTGPGISASRMDSSYRLLQLSKNMSLRKITLRAGLQRSVNVLVTVIGRKTMMRRARNFLPDP